MIHLPDFRDAEGPLVLIGIVFPGFHLFVSALNAGPKPEKFFFVTVLDAIRGYMLVNFFQNYDGFTHEPPYFPLITHAIIYLAIAIGSGFLSIQRD